MGWAGGADATRENLTDAAALIVENTSAKPKTELNCCRKNSNEFCLHNHLKALNLHPGACQKPRMVPRKPE